MKRAVLLFGLSFAVLAGCSETTKPGEENPGNGDVDPRQSAVSADPLEGVTANGVDAVTLTIAAKDSSGAVTKNRPVEITSSVDSDVITLDSSATDANGMASARLTAVKAGVRVITVKVDGIRLNATGQALSIEFVPGAGSSLSFVAQIGSAQVGVPLVPAVKVEVLDAQGNRTRGTDEVTLAVEGGPESVTAAAVDGVATFSSFRVLTPGDHHLVATAPGLASVTSNVFVVSPGAPARLTFEVQPTSLVAAGQPIPLKVAVRDSAGNIVNQGPGSSTVVMVRLYSNPTAATLEGTLSATAAEGIATFDDVRVRKNASGYSLVAFSPDAPYQSAESNSFEVRSSVASVSTSSFSLAPAVGVADGRSPVKIAIRLADAFGNAVPNQAVQLSATGSGNSFSPTTNLFTNAVGRIEAEMTSDVAEDKIVTANVVGQFQMNGVVQFAAGNIDLGRSTFTASKDTATADGVDSVTFDLVLLDASGNPIVGQKAVANSSGTLNVWKGAGANGETDEDGHVAFTLTSVKAESKVVTVAVGGNVFTANAAYVAGAPSQAKSTKKTGDAQTREVATTVPVPLKVQILDANSNPVVGVPVVFAVTKSNGTFVAGNPTASSVTVNTAADGTAETPFTLGTLASVGAGVANASDKVAATTTGVALEFTFNATAAKPQTIAAWPATGARTQADAGATLSLQADKVGVLVTDPFGNAVPNVPIVFEIDSQPGPAAAPAGAAINNLTTATINTSAVAGATYGVALPSTERLNQKPGPNVFKATCTNASACGTIVNTPVLFTITGTTGPASKIKLVSGSAQTGTVGAQLAQPLVSQVVDQFDNAVSGAAVTFAALDTGSVVGTPPAATDASGNISVNYKLGNLVGAANKNVMSATCVPCTGTPKTINFTGTATAAAPSAMTLTSGDAQTGAVATALAQPFRVTLKDSFGNVVPGQTVTFAVTAGGGKFAGQASTTAVTTATGEATATLTLGDTAGANTATATFGALAPVTFNATGTPGAIATLTAISPTSATGTVGQQLAADFVVEARDAKGNLVVSRNAAVTFAVTGGNGATISTTGAIATDATGRAATRLTLGTLAGTDIYTVTATAGTATPVPFKASATAGAATALNEVSGNEQTGPVNNPLPNPIVVKVLDAHNNPVSGVTVTFSVTSGGGSASPATVTTGADGLASTTWTLGSAPGFVHLMRASAPGLTAKTFTAEGIDVGAVAKAAAPNGDNQTGVAGTQLPQALKVLVTAVGGAPMPNQTVTFTAADGSFSPANAVTDSTGVASALYTLGTTAGAKTVTATVGTRSVTFSLTATAGAAANLALTWNDTTSGTVGAALPTPVVATVTDTNGNPVSGVAVTFATANPGASVGTPTMNTGSDGKAQSTWTLGTTAGAQSLTVTAAGLPAKTALATATAGAAASVSVPWAPTASGSVGQTLGTPVVATVTDSHGNPVSGVTVTFTTTDPGASVSASSVATGADGKAQSTWTLGTTPGTQTLAVKAGTLATVTLNTLAIGPDVINRVAGDGQYAEEGAQFGAVVAVTVLDNQGQPATNTTVNFTVAGGSASATLGSATATTDMTGLAWTTVTAAMGAPASIVVTATLASAPTKSVDFHLNVAPFPASACTAYGPSFQTFAPGKVTLPSAGDYALGTGDIDAMIQVQMDDAVGSPATGRLMKGVLLACGNDYAKILVSGPSVNGNPISSLPLDVGSLHVDQVAGDWVLECMGGDATVVVPPQVNGGIPFVEVHTGGVWTGGVCGWSGGAAPAPLAPANSWFVTPPAP